MRMRLTSFRLLLVAVLSAFVPLKAQAVPLPPAIVSTEPIALFASFKPQSLVVNGRFGTELGEVLLSFAKPGDDGPGTVLPQLAGSSDTVIHTLLPASLLDTVGYGALFVRQGEFLSSPFTMQILRMTPPAEVPVPPALALLLTGLAGLAALRRRRA